MRAIYNNKIGKKNSSYMYFVATTFSYKITSIKKAKVKMNVRCKNVYRINLNFLLGNNNVLLNGLHQYFFFGGCYT